MSNEETKTKQHRKHRHHRHHSKLYKGMSRENRHIMRKIYIGAGLLFFAFLIVLVFMFINKKKTDEMISARKEAQATQVSQETEAGGMTGVDLSEDMLLQDNEVEYEGKTYLRNTYVKSYLIMGVDRKDELTEEQVNGSGGQADAIFLAAHDTAHDSVKIVKIPRDTMTPIPMTDLSGNILGVDYQHLTLAFGYGDGREQSCEFMCEAVNRLLNGIKLDGYIASTMNVINVLNDAVGGVDVVIESDGMEAANPAFVKGETVHLEGKMAEQFLRYRNLSEFNSAVDRMDRQTQYLINFEKKFKELSSKNSGFIPSLLDKTAPYTITSMDKGTYLNLAMDLATTEDMTEEDFATLPGKAVEGANFDEYHPDKDEITKLMLTLFYREKT